MIFIIFLWVISVDELLVSLERDLNDAFSLLPQCHYIFILEAPESHLVTRTTLKPWVLCSYRLVILLVGKLKLTY